MDIETIYRHIITIYAYVKRERERERLTKNLKEKAADREKRLDGDLSTTTTRRRRRSNNSSRFVIFFIFFIINNINKWFIFNFVE